MEKWDNYRDSWASYIALFLMRSFQQAPIEMSFFRLAPKFMAFACFQDMTNVVSIQPGQSL